MYQRDFSFLDKNTPYELSVVLMADSFFYSLCDNQGVLCCHQSYTGLRFSEGMSDVISQFNYLDLTITKARAVVFNHNSYLLPHRKDELAFQVPALEHKVNFVENVPGQNAVSYYGITEHQENALTSMYPNLSLAFRDLVSIFSTYYLNVLEQVFHLHIEEKCIYIYIQSQGEMKFARSFDINGMHDVLYFVLAVCKSLDINPSDLDLTLSGWIEVQSSMYNLLKSYIQNIKLAVNHPMRLHHESAEEQKPHYYFLHFALLSCAS
ncbi:MAG: DUF3822 family protein [Saprospiraceae bacterium]